MRLMHWLVAVVVAWVVGYTACVFFMHLTGRPEIVPVAEAAEQDVKFFESPPNFHKVWRFEDPDFGVVCYVTEPWNGASAISCLPKPGGPYIYLDPDQGHDLMVPAPLNPFRGQP